MALTRLKQLRKQNKITQVNLAKVLNVDKSLIAKYETTNVMPSTDVLTKLADFFGVTTDFLLGRTNDLNVLDETDAKADELFLTRKVLFDKSAKATKEDLEMVERLLDRLIKEEGRNSSE